MLLLDTIMLRPYVFVFFLAYLIGCSLHLGLKRAVLFAVFGYCIAWASEFLSIHTGFPYGAYYYIEHTRGQEIWVFGVPFMDSLSYVFLAYAAYAMAILVIAPFRTRKAFPYVLETRGIRNSLLTALVAAVLFVYLDIIIDPVALRGDRWFLGKIYGYPFGGIYFGVPLSNFGGWFLTGFILIITLQKIDSRLHQRQVHDYAGHRYPWRHLIGPALYISVVVFNLTITFFIGEYLMGWVGVFIGALPAMLISLMLKIKLQRGDGSEEWNAHYADFPGVATGAGQGQDTVRRHSEAGTSL